MRWGRRGWLAAGVAITLSVGVVGCTHWGGSGGSEGQEAIGAPVAASVRTIDVPGEVPGFDDETGVDVANTDGDLVALVDVKSGVVTVRRSDDHGRTWTRVKLPYAHYLNPTSTWVRAIGSTFVVIGATDTAASYEQEGPSGGSAKAVASRSADGGKTWKAVELPMPTGTLRGPDIDVAGDGRTAVIIGRFFPTDAGVLAGGWRSTDDGATWTFLPPSALGTDPVVVDHVSMDGGAARIWTSTIRPNGHRLLRSEDGGATWGAEADPPSEWPSRQEDAFVDGRWWRVDDGRGVVDRVDPSRSDDESQPRLLHSDDDGRTWEAVALGPVACAAGVEDPLRRISTPARAGSLLVVMTSCDDDSDGDPDARAGLWGSTDGGDHWGPITVPKAARNAAAAFPIAGVSVNGSAWFPLEGRPIRVSPDAAPDAEADRPQPQALVIAPRR